MSIVTTIEKITPEIAAEMLSRNARNRPIARTRVNTFAKQMVNGEWKLTHQGVAFNGNGDLVDGQHRLTAVVKSGVTVEMLVSRGDIDFDVLDTGFSRTAANLVSMNGWRHANMLAATARLIIRYDESDRPWGNKVILSNHTVNEWVERNGKLIEGYARTAQTTGARISSPPSSILAAFFVMLRWARENDEYEMVEEFMNGLHSGVGMREADPRLAYQSWLNGARRLLGSGTVKQELAMMTCLRAFQAYMRGQGLLKISVKDPNGYTVRLP